MRTRRRRAIIACVAAMAMAPLAPAADARSAPSTFAFAIGNHMLDGTAATVGQRFAPFDLAVVDGEEASSGEIAAIRAHGTVVLGYLSVGTIEKWRGWYPELRRFRLNADANWRDEWFADTSRAGYRHRIRDEIAPSLLDKGFDGLFLDNVDMVETRNHRPQRDGMRRLVSGLSGLVDSYVPDRLLFAQNGAWILDRLDLVGDLDGWNREDVTWTYDFDRRRYVPVGPHAHQAALEELADFVDRGLEVTATDYTARAGGAAEAAAACSAGALAYVSDIGLTLARLPQPPLACP